MINVSNTFKDSIKELDVFSDGKVEIINDIGTINFDRYTIVKIEMFATAFQDDSILGSIAQHSLVIELLGDLTKDISLIRENKAIVKLGILVDSEYEYVTYQDFLITEVSYSDTTNLTKLVGTDNLIKLNKEYVDTNVYPITLKEYCESVLSYCGLELENTSFLNDDFVLSSQPFNNYINAKEIMYRISELALSFIMINKTTNKVELKNAFDKIPSSNTHNVLAAYTNDQLSVFTHNQLMIGFSSSEVDDASKDTYWSFKLNDNNFGQNGVNTLVLKISQVEGENSTLVNDTNVAIDGNIEVSIVDNPFINSESKRLSVISDMFDVINGYKYNPYTLEYRGFPYLEIGDVIIVEQMNEEEIAVPIYELNLKWTGALYGKINAKALSLTETKYRYISTTAQKIRNAEVLVDKVNGEISLVASELDELDNRVLQTEAKLTPEAFTITVQNITSDQYGETIDNINKNFTFNQDGMEISSSENNFAVRLNEEKLGFYDSGIETAYVSNSEFHITKGNVTESLIIGPHKIEKYNTELIVYRFIGGE